MSGTVSSPEIAWLATATLGFLAAIFDTVMAMHDLKTHWSDKGPERGISWSGLLKSFCLLFMTVLGIATGLIAVVTPQSTRPEVIRFQDAIATALIVYQGLLVMVILIKDWERWYVSRWTWSPVLKGGGALHSHPHSQAQAHDGGAPGFPPQ